MFKLSFKQRLTKEMNFLGYQSIMATKAWIIPVCIILKFKGMFYGFLFYTDE